MTGSRTAASKQPSPEIETFRAIAVASLAMPRNRTEEAVASLTFALRCVENRHNDYLAVRRRTVLAIVWLRGNDQAVAAD
ncbi:hypothetical protein [Paraburkholderia youngii]|uniref:hypothetical protein n=1 Tax=Paraburkholderia youngii TaxID=2782701 RepID=UPI001FE94098|nr:hypothetical protein [Paraburkholderia youngii]